MSQARVALLAARVAALGNANPRPDVQMCNNQTRVRCVPRQILELLPVELLRRLSVNDVALPLSPPAPSPPKPLTSTSFLLCAP